MAGRSVVPAMRSTRARPRSVRPTRRGWSVLAVAVAIFGAAVITDRREGLVAAVFLASLLAVAAISLRVRRTGIDVRRRPPSDFLAVGEDADVVLTVSTDSWDASITRWRDVVPASFGPGPSGPNDALIGAPGGGSVRATYPVRPQRRGEFDIGPLVVTREDPFGLLEAEQRSGGSDTVVVTPRVFPLVASELLQASGEGARHEHRLSNHPRVDELIAREYRAGDPMRRIHWRATARRGELMVRQEEQEVDPAVVVLLDTSMGEAGAPFVTGEVFEHMVDLTASISVHVLDGGFRLTLVESVPRGHGPTERSDPSHGSEVLRRLALVAPRTPASEEADVAVVSRDVLDRAGAPVPVVVVLADGGIATARRLAPLARLADPAIAFVAPGAAAEDVLRSAGWIVGVVDPRVPVPEIWNATMLGDRGRAPGVG